MRTALPFPNGKPAPYVKLDNEPVFDPERHLALTTPAKIYTLEELGYGPAEIAECPSSLGLSTAFRVFSDEGLAIVQELAARMKSNTNETAGTGANRLGSYIRGAGYRSTFIRDFCECPALLEFLSALAQTPLARHSVPAVACGINYAPDDISRAVDTWHVDSVAFDVVILLTDPATFQGGEFQYFLGTKYDGEKLLGGSGEAGSDRELPDSLVRTMEFPAAGYGFIQQGNKIFHRACKLHARADRMTMIPSFVTLADGPAENSNVAAMSRWSDPGILAELARHEAWVTRHQLAEFINELPLEADADAIADMTDAAIVRLRRFSGLLRNGNNDD